MKNSRTKYIKIVLLTTIVLLVAGFLLSTISSKESSMERTLVSLTCGSDTFKIVGEAQNMTTAWAMHDYWYNLSFYMNGKFIQRNTYKSPSLGYYKFGPKTIYFDHNPSLQNDSKSNTSLANKIVMYVPSTVFSESEYDNLVKCMEENMGLIKDALNELSYTVKPHKFSSKTFPVMSRYGDIVMITYGEPPANLALSCHSDVDGWMTQIDPSGNVFAQFSKGELTEIKSLGEIKLLAGGKKVWTTIKTGKNFEEDYHYLESCLLPTGGSFFDAYPSAKGGIKIDNTEPIVNTTNNSACTELSLYGFPYYKAPNTQAVCYHTAQINGADYSTLIPLEYVSADIMQYLILNSGAAGKQYFAFDKNNFYINGEIGYSTSLGTFHLLQSPQPNKNGLIEVNGTTYIVMMTGLVGATLK